MQNKKKTHKTLKKHLLIYIKEKGKNEDTNG